MFRKGILVLAVLVLGLGLPGTGVGAQGEGQPPVFCGGLSEADCAILVRAQSAMAEISSAAFDARLELNVSSSEPEVGQMALTITGNGAMAGNMALMATFQQAGADMASLMSQAPKMLIDLLRSVNGRANLLITLPEALAAGSGIPAEGLPLELVVVGGVVYVNTSALMPAEAEGPAWIGLDLPGMYESMLAMAEGTSPAEMPNLEDILSSEAFQALVNVENYADVVRVTRLADAEVGGQSMAVFHTVVDYQALFTGEAFQKAFMDYMAAVAEMQGESLEAMPENFMEVMVAVMSGMSLQATEWIGLTDYYIHRSELTFGYVLNREAIQQVEPKAAEDMPRELSVSLLMTLELSDFNEPVEVTAPEGAQVFNPMMAMANMPEAGN